jgi:copper homeostasis protein
MTAPSRRVLEVIVTSLQEAEAAERGGADRLEVVRDLPAGGLTPSLALVRQIRRSTSIPMRVMLREHDHYAAEEAKEFENLAAAALQFAEAGIDGVVLGFISNQRVDIENTTALLSELKNIKATFHHAFDTAEDALRAIDDVKKCPGIDRILTTGGPGNWEDKAKRLARYQEMASPGITILAGGGLDSSAIQLLLERTPVREFHVGRAARNPPQDEGAVLSSRVAALAGIIHANGIRGTFRGAS